MYIMQRFRNTGNLLHQLPPGHVQSSLVVNLYPDERGYSLILNPGVWVNHMTSNIRSHFSHMTSHMTIQWLLIHPQFFHSDTQDEEIYLPYEVCKFIDDYVTVTVLLFTLQDDEIFGYLDNQEVGHREC